RGEHWCTRTVAARVPAPASSELGGCRLLAYRHVVACPGLTSARPVSEGRTEPLGTNGVTSTYRYALAPSTWQLVRTFAGRRALFTQPPMPLKCAGAPQQAMYLSADHWRRTHRLEKNDVEFFSAGAALLGIAGDVHARRVCMTLYTIPHVRRHHRLVHQCHRNLDSLA
ncbi:hypothetical protein NX875_29390, partial [Burkholderia thailandensis]|nr:hypothetical protein [Burkholderia thailandensis]